MKIIFFILVLLESCFGATKFRLHNSPAAVSGYKAMDLSLGPYNVIEGVSTPVSSITNTAASGTDIQATVTGAGSTIAWISEPLASGFTLSGTVTCNVYGGESNASANAAFRCRLFKYSGGSEGASILTANMTTELNTTIATARNWTGTPTSTSFSAGDRVVFKLFLENCATSGCPTGTMASGFTVTAHYDGPIDSTDGSSWAQLTETVTLSTESGSNALACAVQFGGFSGAPNWTISDNIGTNTWVSGPVFVNNGYGTYWFVAPSVASGTRAVTFTPNKDDSFFSAACWELSNIPNGSFLDGGSGGGQTTSTTPTASSFTPSASGDFLIQVFNNATAAPTASVAVGFNTNITWSLGAISLEEGFGSQWGAYSSTSAIAPTITQGTSNSWTTTVLALKVNGTSVIQQWVGTPNSQNTTFPTSGLGAVVNMPRPAGSSLTGMYIKGIQTTSRPSGDTTNPWPMQCPTTGNLAVVAYGGGAEHLTGITSTPSLTWTAATTSSCDTSGACFDVYYAKPSGAQNSLILSMTTTSPASDDNAMCFDIVGASTSPFTGNVQAATGNQSGTGNFTSVTVTPTAANNIIIGGMVVDFNTMTGIPSPCLLQNGHLTSNTTGNTTYYENNGWASCVAPNTTAIPFTWTVQSGLGPNTGPWASMAAEFNAPASSTARRRAIVIQ